MNEINRLENVKAMLSMEMAKAKDDKRKGEVLSSIRDNDTQIQNLRNFLQSRGVTLEFNPAKAFLSKLTQPRR